MLLSAGAIGSQGSIAFLREVPINSVSILRRYHKYSTSRTFPNEKVMLELLNLLTCILEFLNVLNALFSDCESVKYVFPHV